MSLLARVAAHLRQQGSEFAVIGAAALAVHGIARSTQDLDLLVTDRRCLCRPPVEQRPFLTWIERGGVSLDAGSTTILQPNMTLHLVPYLLVPGRASVGFSETVRVIEGGCEVLTRCPRALLEV